MRDDNAPPRTTDSLPRTVTEQPDPMLEERPAGPARMIVTLAAAAAIIAVALYGITRQSGPEQTAAAPTAGQTAPAGGGAANNAGAQAEPANTSAQNPQPGTTGQGAGGRVGQPNASGQQQSQGQGAQSKTPPAGGGSATSAVGPGAKPAPEGR